MVTLAPPKFQRVSLCPPLAPFFWMQQPCESLKLCFFFFPVVFACPLTLYSALIWDSIALWTAYNFMLPALTHLQCYTASPEFLISTQLPWKHLVQLGLWRTSAQKTREANSTTIVIYQLPACYSDWRWGSCCRLCVIYPADFLPKN